MTDAIAGGLENKAAAPAAASFEDRFYDFMHGFEEFKRTNDERLGQIEKRGSADVVTEDFASRLVWFDTLVSNVDRTARNTNLLMWHRQPWLIDHGASLTFHHAWNGTVADAGKPFAPIAEHVLLPRAAQLAQVDAALAPQLTEAVLQAVLNGVPDGFLAQAAADRPDATLADPAAHRAAYVRYFLARLAERSRWLQGAIDARA